MDHAQFIAFVSAVIAGYNIDPQIAIIVLGKIFSRCQLSFKTGDKGLLDTVQLTNVDPFIITDIPQLKARE